MSSTVYSTVRPAVVAPAQMRLLYAYAPDRYTPAGGLVELDATQYLTSVADPAQPTDELGGVYNLRLPGAQFKQPGIYTLYLRPRAYQTTILDCGGLSGTDLKGLVLDADTFTTTLPGALTAGGLRGYRVEYFDTEGKRVPDYFTIVTWSNRADAVTQNLASSTQRSTAYRFNDSGNLLFLTLTPSVGPAAQPSFQPFIGESGGTILLTPPSFDAQTLEIEVGVNDFETLALGIYGDQTLNNDTGVMTTYRRQPDGSRVPFRQHVVFEVEDEANNPQYVVKQAMERPDPSEDWDGITQNLIQI